MNCTAHPDRSATAYCRTCGKALCEECKRDVKGVVYCEDCLAKHVAGPAAPPPALSSGGGPSPGVALALGFIPGVGAIYNGQYAKAFVHVVILGILIRIEDSGTAHYLEPLVGLLIFLFFTYMAGEAYHTAKKRASGAAVDEWSGFLDSARGGSGRSAGALVLILLGIIFLLNNMGVFSVQALWKYWPVLLIAIGLVLLVQRLGGPKANPPPEG